MSAGPSLTDGDLRLVDRAGVRGAVLLVRERYWLLATLGVVVLSVVFVLLGRWQHGRHDAKVERRDRIEANYDAPAVPLAEVLPSPAAALPADRQWRPVTVTGTYEPRRTLLVRNRPYDGTFGYEVLVPLRLADGGLLVVDRGWIPFGQSATALPPVPAPPAGPVEVVVRLRPGEPDDGRSPPPGQLLRIVLDDVAATLPPGTPLYRAYGVLAQERPPVGDAPLLLERPDTGLGPHLAYAWNWWGFAVAAHVLLGYYALREAQLRRLAARGVSAAQVTAARAARARRRRVRDEDWEDAALDRAGDRTG